MIHPCDQDATPVVLLKGKSPTVDLLARALPLVVGSEWANECTGD